MTTVHVDVTTKAVPNTGLNFTSGGVWQLIVRDTSGNVKHAENNPAAPTFADFDVSLYASGDYTVVVTRLDDVGAVAGSAGGSFSISSLMTVPDIITVTLV